MDTLPAEMRHEIYPWLKRKARARMARVSRLFARELVGQYIPRASTRLDKSWLVDWRWLAHPERCAQARDHAFAALLEMTKSRLEYLPCDKLSAFVWGEGNVAWEWKIGIDWFRLAYKGDWKLVLCGRACHRTIRRAPTLAQLRIDELLEASARVRFDPTPISASFLTLEWRQMRRDASIRQVPINTWIGLFALVMVVTTGPIQLASYWNLVMLFVFESISTAACFWYRAILEPGREFACLRYDPRPPPSYFHAPQQHLDPGGE